MSDFNASVTFNTLLRTLTNS